MMFSTNPWTVQALTDQRVAQLHAQARHAAQPPAPVHALHPLELLGSLRSRARLRARIGRLSRTRTVASELRSAHVSCSGPA